jgi:hydroxymethylpyrimidine pyrophosphatase-like HAD family hydrolase
MQPEIYNTPLKVSVFLAGAPDPEAAARLVQRRVAKSEVAGHYRVVWSSGMHLDIIPAGAGKGNAIDFLLAHLDLDRERLVVAGDSGNDLSMLQMSPHGIVVGNAQPELLRLRDEAGPTLFFATADCAAGVLQGLRFFGVLEGDQGATAVKHD